MIASIPNLWPQDIAVDVLTPVAVLKAQAGQIGPLTKGILKGQVTSTEDGSRIAHQLDVIAPALNGLRREILTLYHDREEPYPVIVDALCFYPDYETDPQDDHRPNLATFEDLVLALSEALGSKTTRSVLQSLIARSNEANLLAGTE